MQSNRAVMANLLRAKRKNKQQRYNKEILTYVRGNLSWRKNRVEEWTPRTAKKYKPTRPRLSSNIQSRLKENFEAGTGIIMPNHDDKRNNYGKASRSGCCKQEERFYRPSFL